MTTSAATVSWPGSWPNDKNNRPYAELKAYTDDELLGMIRENFVTQWEAAEGRIDFLSAGDPAEWSIWILYPALIEIRSRLGLEPLDADSYMDMLGMPKSAKGITAEMIGSLGIARLTRLAREVFKDFRAELGEAGKHLRLRISVAAPSDWALLVNGYFWHIDGFTDAVIHELMKILTFADPQDILFSWESPFGQILTALARPFGFGGKVARHFASFLEQVASILPVDAKIALHPCWGDFKNHSMIEAVLAWVADIIGKRIPGRWGGPHRLMRRLARRLQSPKAIVVFVNAQQKAAGVRLLEVLLCLVAGTAKPSDRAKDYRDLRRLLIKEGVRYGAGIIHRDMTLEQGIKARDAAQQGSGITFASFGPTCGLARVPLTVARQIFKMALSLGGHRQ